MMFESCRFGGDELARQYRACLTQSGGHSSVSDRLPPGRRIHSARLHDTHHGDQVLKTGGHAMQRTPPIVSRIYTVCLPRCFGHLITRTEFKTTDKGSKAVTKFEKYCHKW